MNADGGKTYAFSGEFDQELDLGPPAGNRAFFGLNVLRGLVGGIDDFIAERESRWQRFRAGPALLGSAPWIDDEELLTRLGHMAACIVMTKQSRDTHQLPKLARLSEVNAQTAGVPAQAFPHLAWMAPKEGGRPAVVGPYTTPSETLIETIRTLGYRRAGKRLVPIVHAKLALLGHLWWSDEGPLGHVEEVVGFTPLRLWVSSANFTRSSRRNLEFGYWTEEPQLLRGAERFLVSLIGASEGIDPDPDHPEPDLAPVEFDDAAMAEAYLEATFDEEDDHES